MPMHTPCARPLTSPPAVDETAFSLAMLRTSYFYVRAHSRMSPPYALSLPRPVTRPLCINDTMTTSRLPAVDKLTHLAPTVLAQAT